MESSARAPTPGRETATIPWRALAASLALHALFFSLFSPSFVAITPESGPLHARLQTLTTAPPAPPVIPAPSSTPASPPAPLPTRSAARPPVSPPPTFLAAPEASLVTSTPADSSSGTSTAPAEEAPSAPAHAAGREASAPLSDPAGTDADGLRQYRLALASQARHFRRYPEAARRAGRVGTVQVRVAVNPDEGRPQVHLHQSSGHALLDAAAVDMLRQAAARTALPPSLRGQRFVVLLPVSFEMEE